MMLNHHLLFRRLGAFLLDRFIIAGLLLLFGWLVMLPGPKRIWDSPASGVGGTLELFLAAMFGVPVI